MPKKMQGVKKVSVKGGAHGRAGVKSNKHGTDKGPMQKLPKHMATPRPKVRGK